MLWARDLPQIQTNMEDKRRRRPRHSESEYSETDEKNDRNLTTKHLQKRTAVSILLTHMQSLLGSGQLTGWTMQHLLLVDNMYDLYFWVLNNFRGC